MRKEDALQNSHSSRLSAQKQCDEIYLGEIYRCKACIKACLQVLQVFSRMLLPGDVCNELVECSAGPPVEFAELFLHVSKDIEV